ncbi:MAG: pimeloyl-ACP methyl ester esterase BioH [Lysobacteraceae bacterium]|nr:MAG: pimeloyl-ACP methyl ester esterase BioH [Xanthomonadaceae bacterium]
MTQAPHVSISGEGPPLALIHGWAMHGGVFAPMVDRLRESHTLYLVDLPGHGHSRDDPTALTFDAVCDTLYSRLPRAPWLGWSLGGMFALHAAALRPDRVSALIEICASPCFVRRNDWRFGVSAEIFRDFARGLGEDYRATLERFVALEAFGSDHAKEEIRALRAELFARGEPATRVLVDGLHLLETADQRALLSRLRVPSLWLAGRRDRLVDPRAMRDAVAAIERAGHAPARFAQIEQAGHAPFLTHADEVVAQLAAFLDDETASRGEAVSA